MIDIHKYKIDITKLKINFKSIYRALGYGNNQPPEYIVDLVKDLNSDVSKLISIKGGYRIVEEKYKLLGKEKILVDDTELCTEKIITHQLKSSTGVVLFVCTLGAEFDKWSKQFVNEGDMLKGFTADVLGSEIVEAAVDWLEEKIVNRITKNGVGISNRYSPGYCDWNVYEQHKLFSLLPENFCGISLTDSALMIPMKSVSGIIGFGSLVKKADYSCKICTMEYCYLRIRDEQ